MGALRWRLKRLLKLFVAVFFVALTVVQYAREKSVKTQEIYKSLGSRNVKDLVQPFTNTFIINNFHPNVHKKTFVVIAITSVEDHEYRRQIIRSTWMKYKRQALRDVEVAFFLGKPRNLEKLRNESETFKDIVVDGFEENYYTLGIKTLRILKWFNMNFQDADFLVKTDDDVFLNILNLIKFLESLNNKIKISVSDEIVSNVSKVSNEANPTIALNYVGGRVFSGRSPHTINSFSKWFVPLELWKDQLHHLSRVKKRKFDASWYPDYLEGNFYVISGYSVPLLINASLDIPIFHLEDIYLTGVIASTILEIKLESVPDIFTDSATWPRLSYWFNRKFIDAQDILAYHCDNDIDLIKSIYEDSIRI